MGPICQLNTSLREEKLFLSQVKSGVLENYQLIMNMGGPNFLEPSFANIRPCNGSNVEGVIHKIDKQDLQKIVKTEGEDYQLQKLSVYTEGKIKTAYTLIYKTEETKDIPPSKRYLKILIKMQKKTIYHKNI